jgi:hypothetical protein
MVGLRWLGTFNVSIVYDMQIFEGQMGCCIGWDVPLSKERKMKKYICPPQGSSYFIWHVFI